MKNCKQRKIHGKLFLIGSLIIFSFTSLNALTPKEKYQNLKQDLKFQTYRVNCMEQRVIVGCAPMFGLGVFYDIIFGAILSPIFIGAFKYFFLKKKLENELIPNITVNICNENKDKKEKEKTEKLIASEPNLIV